MNQLSDATLGMIQELNRLWEPVYPYLTQHVQEEYGRKDGIILEVGPFCGVIFSLAEQGVGNKFKIGAFPPGIASYYRGWVHTKGLGEKISVLETDQSLGGIGDDSIDLVVFRGALFFPSLFQVDYQGITRVMKPDGCAMIGGGFGKLTPPDVIRPLADQSKELNLRIGKIEVTEDQIRDKIDASGVLIGYRIVREGGLWVILNKR